MVQWKSAKTIEGTEAERDALPVNFLEIGWRFTTLDTFLDFIWDGTQWITTLDKFSPSDISGLVCWLDGNDLDTITKDGGNLVSEWRDKSGALNHVAQAVGGDQPLWVNSSLGGKPIIRFDGISDYLIRTSYTGGALVQPTSIFMVCSYPSNSPTTNRRIIDGGDGGGRHVLYKNASNLYGNFAGAELLGNIVDGVNRLQYTALFNGANSSLRKSGANFNVGDVGVSSMIGITLGANSGGTEEGDCDIAEVLVYNATLTASEVESIENYLTDKWLQV